MVQWLRIHALNSGGLCLIPGQGTRSSMPQGRMKILMCWNQDFMQPNKLIKKKILSDRGRREGQSHREVRIEAD